MEQDDQLKKNATNGGSENKRTKTAGDIARKNRPQGSKPGAFNESSAQDYQRSDRNPLKKSNDKDTASEAAPV